MAEKPCITKEIHLNVTYNEPTQFKGRSVENGLPVTKPLYYLEELLAWRAEGSRDKGQSFSIASVPYHGKDIPDGSPKTLVCHDMGGGYLDDRFVQGTLCKDGKWYYMAYWDVVDTFVYFSHHFVTIPPVGWINCGHTNGVAVLGTFITEGDVGFKRCEAIFSSDSAWKLVADALVNIAKYYKFEGWLLNIENDIEPQDIDRLKDFVKYLTDEMHSAVTGSQVIWYDSVTVEGVLSWQNELNVENQTFFDRCDGIFLNYSWDEIGLEKSAQLTSRVADVYVGVDVFGRGCYGGGGMNSAAAVEVLRRYSLSAAIFAPGWVKEVLGFKDFEINQAKFWKALAPYCERHAVNVPLQEYFTNFHPGFEVCGDSRYLHLCRQSLLPQMSSGPFLPVPLKSGPHEVVLSAYPGQVGLVFFKAKMRADLGEEISYIGHAKVKDTIQTKVDVTASCSSANVLCTTSNRKVEIQEFFVAPFNYLCPPDAKGNEIDLRLDEVTWAKSDDCVDRTIFFCSTLCLEGMDESLPVIVSFCSGDKSEYERLGIAYCDKYRIHNLRLPDPVRHGPDGKFVIRVEQRHRIQNFFGRVGPNYLNYKCGKLAVTYGEKTTGPVRVKCVSRGRQW